MSKVNYCPHKIKALRQSNDRYRATVNGKRVPEHNTWHHLKERCLNPKSKDYNDYGGRGIKICERWMKSYSNFLDDIGVKPKGKYSIERINVNGDYCPENCKWGTDK